MDAHRSKSHLDKRNMPSKEDVYELLKRDMARLPEPFTVKVTEQTKNINKLFKRRKCTKFVDNNSLTDNQNRPICDICKQIESEGHEKNSDKIDQLNFRECSSSQDTDAYGTIIFPGSRFKSANYICVDVETSHSDLIAYMIQRKGWNLKPPKLILSVIGSDRNLVLSSKMKKEFKRGLIKAAASTSAWIITGGTDNGVMQLVGEAVGDEYHKYGKNLVLLGISSWGNIALRDKLINKEKKSTFEFTYSKDQADHLGDNNLYLCPNNTHFILVDDCSQNESNREFEYRANFENQLRFIKVTEKSNDGNEMAVDEMRSNFKNGLPTILIVVGGDFITLKRIRLAVLQKIPVLVVAESKGCVDLIVDVCKSEIFDSKGLIKVVQNSKIFTANQLDESLNEIVDSLLIIARAYDEKFVHIFDLNSDSNDIELSILTAFIDANPMDFYQNIKLALKWNRFDIVREYLFTGNEKLESKELSDLMVTALVEDKPEFVRYALDQGLNLETFLTVARLKKLYNSNKIFAKKVPLLEQFKRKKKTGFANIRWLLQENLFDGFEETFLPLDVEKSIVRHPEQNLFVWSLLYNRLELAKIFWKLDSLFLTMPKTTCGTKLKAYFSSHWNWLDFLGCVFFTVGFVFRIVSIFTDETYFNVSRIIYAVDLLIWYMRLLHVCMAFKPLGPKLIMIRKMLLDLIVFLIILLIFVLMFGVTTQATMYPGNELNFDLLKNVIGKAYWPVYGEMVVLDEIENSQWGDCSSVTDGKQCVPTAGAVYSLVLLIIYVIIANVLLLNLLIAMFSFQFNLVQENTDTIWKFQKYQLITEYENTYAFPPPICLVQYLMLGIRYFSACRKGAGKFSTTINRQLTQNAEDTARIENYFLTLERESAEEYLNDHE